MKKINSVKSESSDLEGKEQPQIDLQGNRQRKTKKYLGKKRKSRKTVKKSKGRKSIKRAGKRSKSLRAGLSFPVARNHRKLRAGKFSSRVSPYAAVYLSAVQESLTNEILQISKRTSQDNKMKRIHRRHITSAMLTDDLLNLLVKNIGTDLLKNEKPFPSSIQPQK